MRVTIDSVGRLVIPKPVRDAVGLRGGDVLEVEVRDDVIEMRPATANVQLVQTPEGPVASQPPGAPPLTDELVRDTLEQLRR